MHAKHKTSQLGTIIDNALYSQIVKDANKGFWQGYVYFQSSSPYFQNILFEKPQLLQISQEFGINLNQPLQTEGSSDIKINKLIIDPLDLQFSCNTNDLLPCSVSQFLLQLGQISIYQQFKEDAQKNLKKVQEITGKYDNPQKSCFILEIQQDTDNTMTPIMICPFVESTSMELKLAISNAHKNRLKGTPIEKEVNNLQYGESFDIKFLIDDQQYDYATKVYCQQYNVIDDYNETLISYRYVRNYMNESDKCVVSSIDIEPQQLTGIKDAKCCIKFKQQKKEYTICSLKKPNCITPIRRLATFIQKQCQAQQNESIFLTQEFRNTTSLDIQSQQQILDNAPALADNAIVSDLIVSDGNFVIDEKLQFQIDFITRYQSKVNVFMYKNLELIDERPCIVMIDNLVLPQKLLQYDVKGCMSFRYNQKQIFICHKYIDKDTYGSKLKIAKRIQAKCQKARRLDTKMQDLPFVNYNAYVRQNLEKGEWQGYAIFSQLDKSPHLKPMYIEISPQKGLIAKSNINILNSQYVKRIDLLKMEWVCESHYPCSVQNYLNDRYISKNSSVEEIKKIFETIYQKSTQNCLALEFRTTLYLNSQREVFILCPMDETQYQSIREAIRQAYWNKIQTTQINKLPFSPEGSEYEIVMQLNKDVYKKNVILGVNSIISKKDKTNLLNYDEITQYNGVQCGMEFKLSYLPNQLKKLKINPDCCIDFYWNQKKSYLCSAATIRCDVNIRMIMKRVKADCIRNLIEKNQISLSLGQKYLENIDLAPYPKNVPQLYHSKEDPQLEVNFVENDWRGNIYYMELVDTFKSLKFEQGYLHVQNRQFQLAESFEALKRNKLLRMQNLLNLYISCKSLSLCLPDHYLNSQKLINTPKIYQSLANQIEQFFQINQNIKESSQCFVVEFEDPYFHNFLNYLICTKDTIQGPILRQLIYNSYIQNMQKIDVLTDPQRNLIPNISPFDTFNFRVHSTEGNQVYDRKGKLLEDRLKRAETDEVILKYKEIRDCSIDKNVTIKSIQGFNGINKDCCFSIQRFESKMTLCLNQNLFKCLKSKQMIIKRLDKGCKDEQAKGSQNSKHTVKELMFINGFNYGKARQGTVLEKGFNVQSLKQDHINDKLNGKWTGWVYSMPLTDRTFQEDAIKQIYYLSIDQDFITVKSSASQSSDAEDYLVRYKTKNLKFVCRKSEYACNPTQYLAHYRKINTFQQQIDLKDSVLNFIKGLPNFDEQSCSVLEIEEPNTRSTRSELICTVFPEEGEDFKISINQAYYKSLLKADIKKDIPDLSHMTEKFDIKILEEGKIVDDTVVFDDEGIVQHKTDFSSGDKKLIYSYRQIAPDFLDNSCSIWYKNLILPREFGDAQDPNCCLKFKLKKSLKTIHICSNDQYRCIKPTLMVLKKLHKGCKQSQNERKENIFENPNNSPSKNNDIDDKLLFDDSQNGIWRGIVYYQQLKTDAAQSQMAFLRVSQNFLDFYAPDSVPQNINNVIQQDSIESLILRNIKYVCENNKYMCDVKNFQEYYNNNIAANAQDVQLMNNLINGFIKKYLPSNLDQNQQCSILEYNEEYKNQPNSYYIICSLQNGQGRSIKRAISVSLDKLILKADVMQHIELAKQKQFQVQIFDPIFQRVNSKLVRFGAHYLQDVQSGQYLIKYDEIQPDVYGNKCAIWYNTLELPRQLKDNVISEKCCFAYKNPSQQVVYVCAQNAYHCLYNSRQIIKTLNYACQQESQLSVTKDETYKVPEETQPNAEIYGKMAGQSGRQKLGNLIAEVEKMNQELDFKSKLQNSLKINKQITNIQGYFIYMQLPNTETELQNPKLQFITISPEKGIRVFANETDLQQVPLEQYRFEDYILGCQSNQLQACNIFQFEQYVSDKVKKSPNSKFDLNLIRFSLKKLRSQVTEEIADKCIALEFKDKSGPVNKKKPSIKRVLCLYTPSDLKQMQNNLRVNQLFVDVIKNSLMTVQQTIKYEDVNTLSTNYQFNAHIMKNDEATDIQIKLNENGMQVCQDQFLYYEDIQNCDLCYSVQAPQHLLGNVNQDCCLQLKTQNQTIQICETRQFFCEYRIKQVTKFIYEKCVSSNRQFRKQQPTNKPGFCLLYQQNFKQLQQKKSTLQQTGKIVNPTEESAAPQSLVILDQKVIVDTLSVIMAHKQTIMDKLNRLKGLLRFQMESRDVVQEQQDEESVMQFYNDGSVRVQFKANSTEVFSDTKHELVTQLNDKNEMKILDTSDQTQYIQNQDGLQKVSLKNNDQILVESDSYVYKSKNQSSQELKLYSNGKIQYKDDKQMVKIDPQAQIIHFTYDDMKEVILGKENIKQVDLQQNQISMFDYKRNHNVYQVYYSLMN